MTPDVSQNTISIRFDLWSGARKQMGIVSRLASFLQDVLPRRRLVVFSQPFYAGGRWQLLSGDAHEFTAESFHSWEQANAQFRSAARLVALGDPLYDFIVIEEDVATLISDKVSYRRVLQSKHPDLSLESTIHD